MEKTAKMGGFLHGIPTKLTGDFNTGELIFLYELVLQSELQFQWSNVNSVKNRLTPLTGC
jgi:hypothetical protein